MPLRSCRVSVKDVEGITHTVDIHAGTLFEAAAAAMTAFRAHSWAVQALTPAAVLRIEVHLPPVVHDVPISAVLRWLRSPSVSPREAVAKHSMQTAHANGIREVRPAAAPRSAAASGPSRRQLKR